MWWIPAILTTELPYVEVRGEPSHPTLLVIPGGAGHTLRQTRELFGLDNHFRVVHFDPCGVGESTCARRNTWDEMIEDVYGSIAWD